MIPILTIDFETFYSQKFSLKKLTTEEYIRSRRFEVIGVGVKRDAEPTTWFTGPSIKVRGFLHGFDWKNSALLAHNAAFDAAILNWRYDLSPARILDTMSMARAVHGSEISAALASLATHYQIGAKGTEVHDALGKRRVDFGPEGLARYGEYCCNDVELTYTLLQKLLPNVPTVEMRLIDLTLRMFTEPVFRTDEALLQQHLNEIRETKQRVLEETGLGKETLMSNPKFAAALQSMGVEPPVKISKTTNKSTYAFSKSDEAFKALLEHTDPKVQALVSARLKIKSTLEETRTARFLEIGKRGSMPIPLRYYAAHTGRWGGDDRVNLQNLPRGSALKNALVAPPGYCVIDSDSSQIEARTLAWLAGQNDLVSAFKNKQDVYKIMASKIYNKPEQDITKDERFVGKTTILGAGYGMGAVRFKAQLATFGVTVEDKEAEDIIRTYRETYQHIAKLWSKTDRVLSVLLADTDTTFGRNNLIEACPDRGLKLPNGLYIRYPNLREEKNEIVYDAKRGGGVTKLYGAKVIENVCQALARIVIGEQMLMISKRYKVAMTVHDAICCVVPEDEMQEALTFLEECMRTPPKWAYGLPLDCEAGSGKSYGAC